MSSPFKIIPRAARRKKEDWSRDSRLGWIEDFSKRIDWDTSCGWVSFFFGFHSNALDSRPLFRPAGRVTFANRCKSNQKVALSGYRPNVSFTLFNIMPSNTTFIVRHRLVMLLERALPLMALKLHRVAQLRRVELTSWVLNSLPLCLPRGGVGWGCSLLWFPFKRFVFPIFFPLCWAGNFCLATQK